MEDERLLHCSSWERQPLPPPPLAPKSPHLPSKGPLPPGPSRPPPSPLKGKSRLLSGAAVGPAPPRTLHLGSFNITRLLSVPLKDQAWASVGPSARCVLPLPPTWLNPLLPHGAFSHPQAACGSSSGTVLPPQAPRVVVSSCVSDSPTCQGGIRYLLTDAWLAGGSPGRGRRGCRGLQV